MRNDIKAAWRSLRASPGFSAAALLVLTLGIGATTAIFSVVDAVVLRALPFDEHDRLVAVGERHARPAPPVEGRDPDALSSVAPQNYMDWTAEQQVFEAIAAVGSGWLTLRLPGTEPESLVPQRVTASFFDVLRVRPALGRPFTATSETPGRDRVAILSDGLWRRAFGGDPAIVGRTVLLDDVERGQGTYEVIGVMPPDFAWPVGSTRATDIWVPYVVPANQRVRNPQSHSYYLQVIARLKPGVSVQQARAQMDQVAAAIEKANPVWNRGSAVGVRPLVDHIVGARTRSWLLMLLGAVALVLVIACANVANLILARGASRGREIGIRAALGASRARLIRQSLAESLLLSVAGTACGLLFAWWGVSILKGSMPPEVPRVAAIDVNLRVLAAAAALSILTALLAGLVPALQVSRPDLASALKDGARGSTGPWGRRLRDAFVVIEVGLAVVLLVAAALFIGSFVAVLRIDPGFDPSNVLTAQISPRMEPGAEPKDHSRALSDVAERVAGIPGVERAAIIAGGMPLGGSMMVTSMTVAGRPLAPGPDDGVSIRRVTPEYHRTLRIPLVRGRLFSPADRAGAPQVALLNETAARKYFPGEDPIGRGVEFDGPRTVVGVVGDMHQTSLEVEPRAEGYVPLAQGTSYGAELMIRASSRPAALVPAVKAALFAVMPDVPLRNVRTMEEVVGRALAQRRLNMLLLSLFAVLGLAISAVGLYGVMAYVVAQRTREIGVRMALGASRARVVRMVLLNAGALVTIGLAGGAGAAWYLGAVARAFLFRIEPADPRAYAAAVLLLVAAAFVASVIPARRAAAVDPMVALRAE